MAVAILAIAKAWSWERMNVTWGRCRAECCVMRRLRTGGCLGSGVDWGWLVWHMGHLGLIERGRWPNRPCCGGRRLGCALGVGRMVEGWKNEGSLVRYGNVPY